MTEKPFLILLHPTQESQHPRYIRDIDSSSEIIPHTTSKKGNHSAGEDAEHENTPTNHHDKTCFGPRADRSELDFLLHKVVEGPEGEGGRRGVLAVAWIISQ